MIKLIPTTNLDNINYVFNHARNSQSFIDDPYWKPKLSEDIIWLEIHNDSRCIGFIGLLKLSERVVDPHILMLGGQKKKHTRKAVRLAEKYVKENTKFKKVIAQFNAKNKPVSNLLKSCGYTVIDHVYYGGHQSIIMEKDLWVIEPIS